jgi:hypothetical protein
MDIQQEIPSFGQEILAIGSQDRTPGGYATVANKHPRSWLHSAYWWLMLKTYA